MLRALQISYDMFTLWIEEAFLQHMIGSSNGEVFCIKTIVSMQLGSICQFKDILKEGNSLPQLTELKHNVGYTNPV